VTSFGDHSITHLTRAPNGALAFTKCIADGGLSGCEDPPLDPLNNARHVVVSPEGSNVYVASNGDDSVTSFSRAPDGSLTFTGCIADVGQAGCVDPPIDALDNVFTVAISPSGSSVYVGSLTDNSISHLARAPDGTLTFTGCVAEAGEEGCADPPIDSLFGALGVAVSPGGASVYVASGSDASVTHFARELPPCRGIFGTMEGTPGNDVLTGTTASDVIVALAGDDTVDSLEGKDRVCGGDGRDTLRGGPHGDLLDGQGANDRLVGAGGPDRLKGGPGKDVLAGGKARDRLAGGPGKDTCKGGPGTDKASRCERQQSL